MSIPIEFVDVSLSTCASVKKSFRINKEETRAYFRILEISPKTKWLDLEEKGTVLRFNKLNYYKVTLTAYPQGCPIKSLPIHLEYDGTDDLVIVKDHNFIEVTGVIRAGEVFRFWTDPNLLCYFTDLKLVGSVGISNVSFKAQEITQSDIDTKVRYIPSTPQAQSLIPLIPYPRPGENPLLPAQYPTPTTTFPWAESIIPHEKDQVFPSGTGVIITPQVPFGLPPFPAFPVPPAPTGTTNAYPDQYDKLGSVTNSVIYYIGFDQRKILPRTEKWTLFLTNLEDRGLSGEKDDPEWQRINYQKKVYMSALSLDKLQFYLPKIENFVNSAFAAASVYGRPVVSSFQEDLVLFFLRIHIGNDDYPDFVIRWFSDFIKFIGIGDPTNPERNELLMYGNTTSPRIFEYFEQKNIESITKADKSTIAYWWSQAGLSADALVFECVHNIVAFSQFTNVIYSTIYTQLNPTNPLDPTLPPYPDFLKLYQNALNGNDRLNVIREAYRLLVPNSLSFSLVHPKVPDPENNVIKSRHLHQPIMISNTPGATLAERTFRYFSYNPNQYNSSFNTNLDNLVGLPVVTDILQASVTSPLDRETVVDNSTLNPRPIVPIFEKPTYTPFGLGYRRCAGEMLSYLITEKIYEKFSTVSFEERKPEKNYPLISVAPFKRVPDNIFVKQA